MRKAWILSISLLTVLVLLIGMGVGACGGGEVTPPDGEEEEAPPGEEEEEAPPETSIFPDENLEAAVRDALGKPEGEAITVAELVGITTLQAAGCDITDLTGLEYCTSLTGLQLIGNQISDISPLSSLTDLTFINIYDNEISDISPLVNLTSLTRLRLGGEMWGNNISDISALVENSGLGAGDEIWLENNNLDLEEGSEDMENIRALEDRGVIVHY